MAVKLAFNGAAGTVTGSCYRLEVDGRAVLIDCGLFQGHKTLQTLNYGAFPFEPTTIDAVLVTHAHIDHSGLLPKLARFGYRGPIFATEETTDLLSYMLMDSAQIQESEAERQSTKRHKRGDPGVEPAYGRKDALASLRLMEPVEYMTWVDVVPGVRARFWSASHILGSASIEIEVSHSDGEPFTMVFSGDLGPYPVAHDGAAAATSDQSTKTGDGPVAPKDVDYVIVESTYGDRKRPDVPPDVRRDMLRREIHGGLSLGGNVIIPAFAVERTQELLVDLDVLFDSGQLPMTDVFVDSPLAIDITSVFKRHLEDINVFGTPHPFERPNLHLTRTVEESKAIARIKGGAIILAGSGMCEGGRIRHHLKNNLWKNNATILMVGYQAPGTLGRFLLDGARHVRIHGEDIKVAASIRTLDVYSGHADADDLQRWVSERGQVRRGLFITHGENGSRVHMADSLADGVNGEIVNRSLIHMPSLDEVFDLSEAGPVSLGRETERVTPEDLGLADWHNVYAETALEMGEVVREIADPAERREMLDRLAEVLGEYRSRIEDRQRGNRGKPQKSGK